MALKIYNTLTKKKEVFTPLNGKKITMYLCGPTVYDLGHLGHARCALSFDVIRRYLIYKGYKVTFVSNYTDIDDKMINRAKEEKISVKELAEKIIPEYKKDYSMLEILDPDISPKATDFIPEMITLIKKLQEKGMTYSLEDGIYYDIEKFSTYGKLSHQKIEELRNCVRKKEDKNKHHPQDFVLWKKEKPGEPSWKSPWGKGRPGWHIECSAMSMKLLGETFDIHAGGADLIFPHHEDEIAQSEPVTGKIFARYWLHNGFIQINNEKMSKSLGNFFTIRDILKKYSPEAVRYFLIATHYRSPINFSSDQLEQAENTLQGIQEFKRRLKNHSNNSKKENAGIIKMLESSKKKFEKAMEDDFETPKALSMIFDLIKKTNLILNGKGISVKESILIEKTLNNFDKVFNIIPPLSEENSTDEEKKWMERKIQKRNRAREKKDWKTADKIRRELTLKGIELEDSAGKTLWKKIKKER